MSYFTKFVDKIVTLGAILAVPILLLGLKRLVDEGRSRWASSAETSRRESLIDSVFVSVREVGQPTTLDDSATVIEFVDYECPACRAIETGLRKASNPRLRVRIYQYPLTEIHPKAMNAARAAVCAKAQGALASIHPIMMAAPLPEKLAGFRDIAGEANVPDVDRFLRCLDSRTSIELVERDQEFGRRLGVRGTPSFFAVTGEALTPSEVAKQFP